MPAYAADTLVVKQGGGGVCLMSFKARYCLWGWFAAVGAAVPVFAVRTERVHGSEHHTKQIPGMLLSRSVSSTVYLQLLIQHLVELKSALTDVSAL